MALASSIQPEAPPHTLTVLVYGTPTPQGSKIAVAKGILRDDNPAGLNTWREDVKLAALRALADNPGWERSYPALTGHFTFTMARPKSHFGTGRNADQLRTNAPTLHSIRPDLDKLLRSTWDALKTAGAYADDPQLAQVGAMKAYAVPVGQHGILDRPGARITLVGVAR